MGDPFKNRSVPKAALVGAAALVGVSLVLTTAHTQFGFGAGIHGPGDIVETRNLVFEDGSAGRIMVKDAETGSLIADYPPGGGQFVRNLVRIMAKDRLAAGGGHAEPFTLALREGGYLSITDPVTEVTVELNAFGRDNIAAFAGLLHAQGEPS